MASLKYVPVQTIFLYFSAAVQLPGEDYETACQSPHKHIHTSNL